MTDEQLQAILGMTDLDAEEKKLKRRQALSHQLRQYALQPAERMDWGSQAARAISGLAAGYSGYKEGQALDEYGVKKQGALDRLRAGLTAPKPPQLPADYGFGE